MNTINELNGDFFERDKIIFGEYEENKYLGGIRRFECSLDVLKELVEKNYAAEDECQNCSPYIKDFIELAEESDLDIEFECYAVSPARDDYRVTVEGMDVVIPDTDFDNITYYVESLHFADEFSFEHRGSNYYLHAWWD